MENPCVTRFAPSPTGLLHLGNARTAFFSWLYARHRGGRFVLRVEDTDAGRSTPEHVAALIEDLAWLGLEYDAGPGRDEGLLLGIIGGDSPAAEISPEGVQRLIKAGIFKPEQAAA